MAKLFPMSKSTYQIKTFDAHEFQRELTRGRTTPCLITCKDGTNYPDCVIKPNSSAEFSNNSRIFELIGALLAQRMGLSAPEPVLIRVSDDFARAIMDPKLQARFLKSIGLNFGSKYLGTGFSQWLPGDTLTDSLHTTATTIFCFDMMIQNCDRKIDKPNLLTKGKEVFVIDHELGFSFTRDLFASESPWKYEAFNSMVDQHVFYRKLKGKCKDLSDFESRLKILTEDDLNVIFGMIPAEWNSDSKVLAKMFDHIKGLITHSDQFTESLKRALV